MSGARAALIGSAAWLLAACASAPSLPAQVNPRGATPPVVDSLDANGLPAGFGSLRQDDIAVRITPANGLQVRAVPLDERFIRLLSPDSYKSLHDLVANQSAALTRIRERNRLPAYSIWYVSFFALEQGETRFSPNELIINNSGRDFRPLDLVPLTPGFGEYRLKQREVQSALLVFDGQLNVNQPLTATMEGTSSVTDWTAVLQRVERERALVRSRAQSPRKPPQ